MGAMSTRAHRTGALCPAIRVGVPPLGKPPSQEGPTEAKGGVMWPGRVGWGGWARETGTQQVN